MLSYLLIWTASTALKTQEGLKENYWIKEKYTVRFPSKKIITAIVSRPFSKNTISPIKNGIMEWVL